MAPLQTTPPSHKNPKRVLRRPPILEDYINVTSTEGTRVFMAVREDPSRTGVEVRGVWRPGVLSSAAFCDLRLAEEQSFDEAQSTRAEHHCEHHHEHHCTLCFSQLPDSLGWNARRPLHLLGVPFSYLKEQVNEEVSHLPALPAFAPCCPVSSLSLTPTSCPVCPQASQARSGDVAAFNRDNKQVRCGQLLACCAQTWLLRGSGGSGCGGDEPAPSILSLGSLGLVPSPVLAPCVVWDVLILPRSCLETCDDTNTMEPQEAAEAADKEESSLHCLWVDKFTPRRYMELLSDDVSS